MGRAQGWGASFGIGEEDTFDTYMTPDVYIPISSESVKGSRPVNSSGNIFNTRANTFNLPGIIECTGNFQFEADAHHLGLPLKLWNGQVSSAAFAPSATPTATIAAGGTLPAGVYYYKTAVILQRTSDGKRFWGSGSSASSSVTSAASDNTTNLSWTNPAIPSGHTHYGTAIFRTPVGVAATTTYYLSTVVGTGTSTTDTGSATLSSIPLPAAIYRHSYLLAAPVAGTHPLPSFSVTKLMDQAGDTTETYTGARMGSFQFAIGDPSAPAQATFELMARKFSVIANPSPTYTRVRPMMNWQGFATVDGTLASYFEGCDFTSNNGLETVPALAGEQYHRDFYPGMRETTGTLNFGYENKDNWDRMRNATEFSLSVLCDGTPTTAGSLTTISSVVYQAYPYSIEINMPKCLFTDAGGNISGGARMTESAPFRCSYDSTLASELAIYLVNGTASYA